MKIINLVLFLLGFHSTTILAQFDTPLTKHEQEGFKRISADENMLYGGRPRNEGEFPMVFNVGFCTVTVVGPETFHSASHCHTTGSRANFTYKGIRRNAICTRHPNYQSRGTQNDWALCKFSPPIEDPDFIYASLKEINMNEGDTVIMMGYGRGSRNGKLHYGKMPISRIRGQEIFTQGATVLGGGDSGGPLMADQESNYEGQFNIVGVNSRAGGGMSIFNFTAHPNAQWFYQDWARENNTDICGITKDCNVIAPPPPPEPDPDPEPDPKPEPEPEPKPDPTPPAHCDEERRFVDLFKAKLEFFEKVYKSCK